MAVIMGFGTNNIIKIDTDCNGIMILSKLEEKIKELISQNIVPLMVNATIGTTVIGAIDPIGEIALLCQKYKIWCHVDACLGGPALMATKIKHKLAGIENIDSLTWDFHKLHLVPMQCVIFITK